MMGATLDHISETRPCRSVGTPITGPGFKTEIRRVVGGLTSDEIAKAFLVSETVCEP